MEEKIEPTFWARIYISGPIEVAEQLCRAECFREGLCVTIYPTKFIYTGGEEQGYIVELINYPRFPQSKENIKKRAITLAKILVDDTYQHSMLVMTPDETIWVTKWEQ